MWELNRQQIRAALGCSESRIRRLEQAGLPFNALGAPVVPRSAIDGRPAKVPVEKPKWKPAD